VRIHPAAAARCLYTDSPENERQTRPPADVARLSTNRKTSGAQPQEREKKGKENTENEGRHTHFVICFTVELNGPLFLSKETKATKNKKVFSKFRNQNSSTQTRRDNSSSASLNIHMSKKHNQL
jgi:hypothetical protein